MTAGEQVQGAWSVEEAAMYLHTRDCWKLRAGTSKPQSNARAEACGEPGSTCPSRRHRLDGREGWQGPEPPRERGGQGGTAGWPRNAGQLELCDGQCPCPGTWWCLIMTAIKDTAGADLATCLLGFLLDTHLRGLAELLRWALRCYLGRLVTGGVSLCHCSVLCSSFLGEGGTTSSAHVVCLVLVLVLVLTPARAWICLCLVA